ncbi:MAG: 1-acyl-sn-glycerol-3-phosphate acyltransferase [Oligoflexales bacterium]|nr:1-acyl-sn-glycerol-3-phosphate acyltransferase [Oligoflexales bacterium]
MLLRIIKTTWLLTFFTIITVYYFIVMGFDRLRFVLRGKPYSTDAAHTVAAKWGRALLRGIPGWDVDIQGEDNLPKEKTPFVIVANHESGTDILAIYFLGIQFRWLSKHSVFDVPMVGSAMRAAGYVPVVRGDKSSHAKALRMSETILKEGTPMLYFPEGTRSTSGRPKEFKTGAFRLAQKCGLPVLPIVLHGSGKLLKKKTICPNSATIKISILPFMTSLPDESPSEFTHRVREKMLICHDQISMNGKDNSKPQSSSEELLNSV